MVFVNYVCNRNSSPSVWNGSANQGNRIGKSKSFIFQNKEQKLLETKYLLKGRDVKEIFVLHGSYMFTCLVTFFLNLIYKLYMDLLLLLILELMTRRIFSHFVSLFLAEVKAIVQHQRKILEAEEKAIVQHQNKPLEVV